MEEFKIEVPINMKEQISSNGKSGETSKGIKDLIKGIKKLDKTMFLNIDIIEILSSFLGDLYKILQPLFKVLSLLFMVVFLPLIPLITKLVEVIARVIEGLMKLFGGEINLGQFFKEYLGPALLNIVKIILEIIIKIITAIANVLLETFNILVETIVVVAQLVWKGLSSAFWWLIDKISEGAMLIWNKIKQVGNWFKELPIKIWGGLKLAWDWLGEKIKSAWEIIKKPFEWMGNAIRKLVNGIISLINKVPGLNIPKLAKGGIVSSPTIAMIGESGPEAVVPLNKMNQIGNTININNPSVRNDQDIKKIANEVSRVLQRQINGRISSG